MTSVGSSSFSVDVQEKHRTALSASHSHGRVQHEIPSLNKMGGYEVSSTPIPAETTVAHVQGVPGEAGQLDSALRPESSLFKTEKDETNGHSNGSRDHNNDHTTNIINMNNDNNNNDNNNNNSCSSNTNDSVGGNTGSVTSQQQRRVISIKGLLSGRSFAPSNTANESSTSSSNGPPPAVPIPTTIRLFNRNNAPQGDGHSPAVAYRAVKQESSPLVPSFSSLSSSGLQPTGSVSGGAFSMRHGNSGVPPPPPPPGLHDRAEMSRQRLWQKWWALFQRVDVHHCFFEQPAFHAALAPGGAVADGMNQTQTARDEAEETFSSAKQKTNGSLDPKDLISSAVFFATMNALFSKWRRDMEQTCFRSHPHASGTQEQRDHISQAEMRYLESVRIQRLVSQSILMHIWQIWTVAANGDHGDHGEEEAARFIGVGVGDAFGYWRGGVQVKEEEEGRLAKEWVRQAFPSLTEAATPPLLHVAKTLTLLYFVDRVWKQAGEENEVGKAQGKTRQPKDHHHNNSNTNASDGTSHGQDGFTMRGNSSSAAGPSSISPSAKAPLLSPFYIPVAECYAPEYYRSISTPVCLADFLEDVCHGFCGRRGQEGHQAIISTGGSRMPSHPPKAMHVQATSFQSLREDVERLVANAEKYNGGASTIAHEARRLRHSVSKWCRNASGVYEHVVEELERIRRDAQKNTGMMVSSCSPLAYASLVDREQLFLTLDGLWSSTTTAKDDDGQQLGTPHSLFPAAALAATTTPAGLSDRVMLEEVFVPQPAFHLSSSTAPPSTAAAFSLHTPTLEERGGRKVLRLGLVASSHLPPAAQGDPEMDDPSKPNSDTEDDDEERYYQMYGDPKGKKFFWLRCDDCQRWRILPREIKPVPSFWRCVEAGRRCSRHGRRKVLQKLEKKKNKLLANAAGGAAGSEAPLGEEKKRRGRRKTKNVSPPTVEVLSLPQQQAFLTPSEEVAPVPAPPRRRGRPPKNAAVNDSMNHAGSPKTSGSAELTLFEQFGEAALANAAAAVEGATDTTLPRRRGRRPRQATELELSNPMEVKPPAKRRGRKRKHSDISEPQGAEALGDLGDTTRLVRTHSSASSSSSLSSSTDSSDSDSSSGSDSSSSSSSSASTDSASALAARRGQKGAAQRLRRKIKQQQQQLRRQRHAEDQKGQDPRLSRKRWHEKEERKRRKRLRNDHRQGRSAASSSGSASSSSASSSSSSSSSSSDSDSNSSMSMLKQRIKEWDNEIRSLDAIPVPSTASDPAFDSPEIRSTVMSALKRINALDTQMENALKEYARA